jgi:hypothetical protein
LGIDTLRSEQQHRGGGCHESSKSSGSILISGDAPYNRGMRFGKLRIAWSVGWGILCLLFVALWVRSYRWVDILGNWPPTDIVSYQGRLYYDGRNFRVDLDTAIRDGLKIYRRPFWLYCCRIKGDGSVTKVGDAAGVPIWTLALITGLAAAVWPTTALCGKSSRAAEKNPHPPH